MESLDTINEDQRRILNDYQSVTHSEDINESIRILADNDWNLETAVQNRYTPSNRHATTITEEEEEDIDDSPSSTSALLGRNTRTANSQPNRRIASLFMWPFNLAFKLTWTLVQFTVRLLYRPSITASGTTPRRNDPRFESDRFLREFESTYGTAHPKFFEGSYTQALTVAKRDLKYLLVILSSEEHDDTDKFCHDTLTNPELIDFLNQQQVLVWGGNVRYTEAFQVSNTLQATTYPFLAIIALHQPLNVSGSGSGSSSKMAVIERMEGPVTPANIMRRFESAISRTGPHLNHLRMEREQRELEHRLRQEQDSAYRASLKIDQEKERKAEQERQQAQLAEQQRIENKRNKKLYIKYLVQQFNEEEEQTETEKMTKISFRLANGDRVIRKFKATDSLERLYQFVEIYPFLQEQEQSVGIKELPTNKDYKHKFSFTIHSPFPRTVYQADSTILIQDEKSLWPSATLIVDTIDDEEEEDEE